MPFDWNEFLKLAEDLALKPDVASKRTAISRAYYFVFNTAFARAKLTTGAAPAVETFHSWCWNKYTVGPDPACMQLGNIGVRMKARRVRADYNAADIFRLDDEVARTIADAKQFRTDLAALDRRYPLP